MREIVSPLDGIRGPFPAQRVFPPAVLFALAEPGVWYDPSDLTTLFQDTAGTQPVTTAGQSVALMLDKSGRGNHATQSILASRPTYALHPSSGIRNVANGSADVGNTAVWPNTATQNGITATKVGSGFDTDGLPYVDVRYQGTATNTFHTTTYAGDQSRTSSGAVAWASSFIARVVSGSTAGVSGIRASVREETAPSTFIGITDGNAVTSTTDTQTLATRTLTTGNQASVLVSLNFTNGATIDITYRIKALQFERGSSRTAYQRVVSQFDVTEAGVPSLSYLSFDGIDDFMVTPAINFTSTDKVTVFAGVRKLSDTTRGMIAELGTVDQNRFRLAGPSSALNDFDFSAGGTSIVGCSSAVAAPFTAVITGAADIAADSIFQRRNGVQVQTNSADQGTGNFRNDIIYIGRRAGTSFPFNGYIYSLIVRGAATDAGTITSTETWVNGKTGAY